MNSNDTKFRKFFQAVKAMSNEQFMKASNDWMVHGYLVSENSFIAAMDIVLTPKQKKQVIARAAEIRGLWLGIEEVIDSGVKLENLNEYGNRREIFAAWYETLTPAHQCTIDRALYMLGIEFPELYEGGDSIAEGTE